MAAFPPIQFKRSATVGAKPTDSDILIGEIAINLRDRIIYTKNDSDQVVSLGITPDYDSDIAQLRRDFAKADSEQTLDALRDVIIGDSENATNDLREAGKVLGWDSDLGVWKPVAAASAISNLTDVKLDSDDGTTFLQQGSVLVYDSDTQLWVPGLSASAISNLVDVKLDSEDGTVFVQQGSVLVYDSDTQLWIPGLSASSIASLTDVKLDSDDGTTFLQPGYVLAYDSDFEHWVPVPQNTVSSVAELSDVNLTGLYHGNFLSWDSDSEVWKPTLSAATVPTNEQFLATAGQTDFVLADTPAGDVLLVRNSMMINVNAYFDSDNVVVYVPANNNNQVMQNNDRVEIRYNKITSTVPTRTVNDITFQDLSGPVDGGGAAG